MSNGSAPLMANNPDDPDGRHPIEFRAIPDGDGLEYFLGEAWTSFQNYISIGEYNDDGNDRKTNGDCIADMTIAVPAATKVAAAILRASVPEVQHTDNFHTAEDHAELVRRFGVDSQEDRATLVRILDRILGDILIRPTAVTIEN